MHTNLNSNHNNGQRQTERTTFNSLELQTMHFINVPAEKVAKIQLIVWNLVCVRFTTHFNRMNYAMHAEYLFFWQIACRSNNQ